MEASSGRVIAGQLADGRLYVREVNRFANAFSKDPVSGYHCWPIDGIYTHIQNELAAASSIKSPHIVKLFVPLGSPGPPRMLVASSIDGE